MGGSYSAPAKKRNKIFAKCTADLPSTEGKVIVITGCTTGTGLSAAKFFAERGCKRLLMLNRPSARAEEALGVVKALGQGAGTEVIHVDCDLASFESVRAAVARPKSPSLNLCGNQPLSRRAGSIHISAKSRPILLVLGRDRPTLDARRGIVVETGRIGAQ